MRVLIADDDPITRLTLADYLEDWGYEVSEAQSGNEAMTALQGEEPPRLLLLDWNMPGKTGLEIAKTLRARNDGRFFYIIFVTGNTGSESIVEAMDAGADDYIHKPFLSEEVRVRVRAGQRIISLQQELTQLATQDELTGLWNRRRVMELGHGLFEKAKREGLTLQAIMLDIDYFKRINDSYGHHVGDAVLKTVGRHLKEIVRPYDPIGRYGGEEFVAFIPDTLSDDVLSMAERIRSTIEDLMELRALLNGDPVTVSLGVAAVGSDTQTLEELLRHADEALYNAKHLGRNQVCEYMCRRKSA